VGFDDGVCEVALDGRHQLELDELVVNDRGLIDQVHRCIACGLPAYDASADQEARRRPPL
jgi:hypothetical protein